MTALGYVSKPDSSKAIRRQTPAARSYVWREAEVVRLIKNALRSGLVGLAGIIAVAWDSALSPVDARKLTFAQMTDDGRLITFRIARAKTGRAALGTLGKRSSALVRAYVASLPSASSRATKEAGLPLESLERPNRERTSPDWGHLPTAQIFRHRKGRPYTKDGLGHDFAAVREAVFGKGETRTLADMRRSVAVEARAGGATNAQIGAKLANGLATNTMLDGTYLPVDRGAVEAVDAARIRGRRKK